MLAIRHASMDDIEDIVAMGERGHKRGANARFDFSGMRARVLVAQCITRRTMCALVASDDSGIVGFLLGNSDEYPYIAMRYATDLATYSEAPGAGRALIEAFTRWADANGCDQIIVGVTYGGRSERGATALYRRLGFTHVGGMFTRQRSKA